MLTDAAGAGALQSGEVDFQQKGEQLTETYHSQCLGDAKLTGTVKGNALESAFEADAGGQAIWTATKK
jgi:hypothetical protein